MHTESAMCGEKPWKMSRVKGRRKKKTGVWREVRANFQKGADQQLSKPEENLAKLWLN